MPYQANRDATIPKIIGTTRNAEGERVAHYESVTYPAEAVVFEKEIAPHVLRRLEEGDDRLSSLLRYIDPAEAQQILGEQVQEVASLPSGEEEILHQEERMGAEASGAPSASPEFDTPEPPHEPPPAGKGDSGAQVGEVPDETATIEETGDQGSGSTEGETEAEGASDDASDATGESEEPSTEVETQTDAEAADSSADEAQEDGQGQTDESQDDSSTESESSSEETVEDEFSNLDKKGLLDKAKEAKIPKRTKMDEDQLRAALRGKAE